MSLTLGLQIKQHLTLTPRLQQSLRLLQLSSVEFQQELRNALDTNPFLEDAPFQVEGESALDRAVLAEGSSTMTAEGAPVTAVGDTEIIEYGAHDDMPSAFMGATFARGSTRYDDEGSDRSPGDWAPARPTLRQQLHDALHFYPLSQRDREAVCIVIDALDDDGYLRQDLTELAEMAGGDTVLSAADMLVALRHVQSFDQPGIGARSLSECLLLQLDALAPETPGRAAARLIAEHHLEKLARRETGELQKQLGCTGRILQLACALVRKMDPRPGNQYGDASDSYIVPDVIVRRVRDCWAVTINPAVMPRARIHRLYAELFAQSGEMSHSPLAQQLQEARWLLRNAHKRFDTIQRVGACIVARQHDFFQHGEIALKPLVLRDIAEELDLHESTISRATGNKYMATPHGTFEFKHFFPRKLETKQGGTCSAATARALLKEMIAAEDTRAPLSDVVLRRRLAEHGVVVARRTVTKYRQALKVPSVELRKRV